MIPELGIDQIGEWVRTGGTVGLMALAAKLFIDNRRLNLATSKDNRDGYGNLIGLLEARVGRLEVSEQRCQRDLADAMKRIAQLEGYDVGQGQVRQEVTRLQASERQDKGNTK
jgi:hypothetical protein